MSAARGLARHYGEALDVIRARINELGITYETVDELAGLPTRYTSKCLCVPPKKRYSIFSLFSTWGAIGLAMQGVEDLELTLRAKSSSQFRLRKHRLRKSILGAPRTIMLDGEFMRQIGVKGGVSRAKKMTAKQRSAFAKRMNKARWRKPRIVSSQAVRC